MAKDTFYFTHDYNSRNDMKIKKLISKQGYLGFGVFWAIIEDLYNNANALQTDYDCIAFELRTDTEIVKSVINDFDLFVIDKKTFGSLSVERRLNERNAKSIKAKESANKRWEKIKSDANALRPQSECNAIKESKGNIELTNVNLSGFQPNAPADPETPPTLPADPKPPKAPKAPAIAVDWAKLLEQFNKITGRRCIVVDEKTKRQVRARLKEGYSKQLIVNAIENCFNDPYHKENPHFLTLEFITRPDKMQKYATKPAAKSGVKREKGSL